jgi:hypothetical protein
VTPGARGLDRRVHGQQVGLLGDGGDLAGQRDALLGDAGCERECAASGV